MAYKVKRFIRFQPNNLYYALFVLALCLLVKTGYSAPLNDRVIKVIAPFELHLEKTGPVRLAGLLYQSETNGLNDIVKAGDRVHVTVLSQKPDRYGRKAAHVFQKKGSWLQGELVRRGDATPYPHAGEEAFIRDLYELETPRTKDALRDDIKPDQFAIIDGLVVDVAEVKNTTYLNFGVNWREDFTIRIQKKAYTSFYRAGFDLSELKGKKVRIRGWVIQQNGPMIDATHPAQMQILSR